MVMSAAQKKRAAATKRRAVADQKASHAEEDAAAAKAKAAKAKAAKAKAAEKKAAEAEAAPATGSTKQERYVTPAGVASYPWLLKADTKFNKDGEYKVDLVLTDPGDITAQIDTVLAAYMAQDPSKGKRKKWSVHVPYSDELDDEGDETGNTVIRFKQNATIRYNDKKTGKPMVVHKTIPLFDAKGLRSKGVNPYSGSVLKVAFTINPYAMASRTEYGASLRIVGVQIISLVTGDDGSADGMGFEEEEGYEFVATEDDAAEAETEAVEGEGEGEPGDF
jgi:hypothetical protein